MDWYRRKTWTDEDQRDYFERLNLAKKHNRPQYLRIQAIELLETGEKENLEAAEKLLKKQLSEFPEERVNRSSAFRTLGEIERIRGNSDKALNYYRKALNFEKEFPNSITQAYLDFSELVVKEKREEDYNFVQELLLSRIDNLAFPIEKYKAYSILSIINKKNNELEKAKEFAKLAEQFVNAETSGFRYHKKLGVVKERVSWLDKLVGKIHES